MFVESLNVSLRLYSRVIFEICPKQDEKIGWREAKTLKMIIYGRKLNYRGSRKE
jgi:hypothetical protein